MNKNTLWTASALALVVVALGCAGEEPAAESTAPAPAPETAAAPAAGSGAVAGVATYVNGDPDTAIKMDADPVCAGLHTEPVETEQVVAAEGKLANVFVYVKEGLTGNYQAPAEAKLLNQEGCRYIPHVSGIMVGQKLTIQNSDPTLHNVHALPEKNQEFNQGQPFQGMTLEKQFTEPEVMVRFKCDVHPWMAAYMAVLEHPFYAVTGADGSYEIDGLPPGDYVLEAWHETMGTQTRNVTVAADAAVDASFDFAPVATAPAG